MFVDNYIPSQQLSAMGMEQSEYQSGAVLNEGFAQGMRWDPGLRRPYKDKYGRPSVTINTGRWTTERGVRVPLREHRLISDVVNNYGIMSPVFNSTSLRKEEWKELDRVVLRAARYRLLAWADLAASNSFGGFNGMSKLVLEYETMADPGEAIVDMTGLTEGRTDSPLFQLQGLPLPITHSDFWYDARRLAVSRNTGTPLDVTMGEAAGRRVAEMLETTTIGITTGLSYGGTGGLSGGGAYGRSSKVYGYLNYPDRLTYTTLTAPTTGGWTASTTLNQVLAMKDILTAQKFYGPFMIYTSNDWDKYMDGDYILTGGNVATQTLRQRIEAIKGISGCKRLDYLFGSAPATNKGPVPPIDVTLKPFTLIFVQQTAEVARAVNGMDITTVQWESIGGMRLNFKVMCIQVPQIRSDYYGNSGILQATVS